MTHTIGISGSTIMSNEKKFNELFQKKITHIEIGEFENEQAFQRFLQLHRNSNKTFGIHSPVFRSGSKYDLLEKFQHSPEKAWHLFEQEIRRLVQLDAKYILVHFPYFQGTAQNPEILIEQGLKRLSELQHKYNLPIVCEPKLGLDRSPKGIEYLDAFPLASWKKYGLKLCIDIGDYLLAADENALEMIQKWKDHIKVVHLHNIEFMNDKYIWIPIHPSHEDDGKHYPIKEILHVLAESPDIYWVLEHTPHSNPLKHLLMRGYIG
ncbi:sugar phosphate isomerase/epimerase family protein [Fictibacillus phosphorivorans]|uniref:sugar phosphate isomerase/epimerase family protein n=1 Tax=Fictibacillus phosphorivorans TaxID=1221500 RepID=UPI001D179961|nr:TIM barrel protein [Fictibacillus phosphorivorans]